MVYFARIIVLSLSLFSFTAQAITVVASIPPLAMLADALLLGVDKSTLLADGRQSVHSLSLLPSHRQALAQADLILWVSPELESWLAPSIIKLHKHALAVQDLPNLQLLSTTAAQQHEHQQSHGGWDFHIWTDPDVMSAYLIAMRDELILIDPLHAQAYNKNSEQLIAQINTASQEAKQLLLPVKNIPLLVMHDAWRYYFRYFGLIQGDRVQITPEQTLGAASMMTLEKKLRNGELRCVLREPQFEPKVMDWLHALAPDLKEALTDPLGNVNDSGGYPAWLVNQAKAIAQCAHP